MFQRFYPDDYQNSTYEINYEELYKKGYRAIIFDIDNTLVPHGAPADQKAIAFFERLHSMGFATRLLSNNKEPRVKGFADQVRSSYCYKAGKPSAKNYIKSMQQLNTDQQNTLFIGDQIFTDIWGAKKAGLTTILVKPIDKKEEFQIVLKRIPEKLILYFYKKEKQKG